MIKIVFTAIFAGIIFSINFWLAHSRKIMIAPITNRWPRCLLGILPWAVVYIFIYGAIIAWAVSVHAFNGNSSDLTYFLLCTVLFISTIPSWWAYKGEGGYLIGFRLIKKESILEEVLLPGKRPILSITIQNGKIKSVIKLSLPIGKAII